jgi:MFS family permease
MSTAAPEQASDLRSITKRQWTTLAGTMLGWGMEGFDVALFALVVGPAVVDLLGPGAAPGEVVFHVGLAITVFLTAWALGAIGFGVLADYIGRVRVLTIGILLYAVFTALSATAHEYWLLLLFRFVAGLGSGIEAPVGAALMAETWDNRYRARATGIMMSGYAAGYFLASWVYGWLHPYGWRATLAVAVLPALLVLFIRRFVHEPEVMTHLQEDRRARRAGVSRHVADAGGSSLVEHDVDADTFVLRRLFTRPLLRFTVLCSLIQVAALMCFWATSTWTPQIIRELSAADGLGAELTAGRVTQATALLNLGGLLGYATWGFIADGIGRRGAFLVSFLTTAVGVGVLYPFDHDYSTFLWLLPLVGFGIFGTLAGPSVYFPEIFPVGVRVSSISVTNSLGRFLTAPGPLVAGAIAATSFAGDLGLAVTTMCSFVVLGIVAALLGPETRDRYRRQPALSATPVVPTD